MICKCNIVLSALVVNLLSADFFKSSPPKPPTQWHKWMSQIYPVNRFVFLSVTGLSHSFMSLRFWEALRIRKTYWLWKLPLTHWERYYIKSWYNWNLLTYTLLIKTSKYQIFIIHVNILKKLAFKDWLKTSLYVFFDETDAAIWEHRMNTPRVGLLVAGT